jgi:hypothetical protein
MHSAAIGAEIDIETNRVFEFANGTGGNACSSATLFGYTVYCGNSYTIYDNSAGGTLFSAGQFVGLTTDATPRCKVLITPGYIAAASDAANVAITDADGHFDTDNVEAALNQIIDDLALITATHGANMIGFQDSGNKTTAATVDAALDALFVEGCSAQGEVVLIPPDFVLAANGAPLAVYSAANDGTAGLYCDGTKALAVRWNNTGGTTATLAATIKIPTDMDVTVAPIFRVKCAKTGATADDNPVFAVGVYAQTTDALYDAGSNLGANTAAVAGDAIAKTVQLVSTSAASALPDNTSSITVTINPAAADLATDDLLLFNVVMVYTRKLRTS